MLRRQKHALSQSTTPLACTLKTEVEVPPPRCRLLQHSMSTVNLVVRFLGGIFFDATLTLIPLSLRFFGVSLLFPLATFLAGQGRFCFG